MKRWIHSLFASLLLVLVSLAATAELADEIESGQQAHEELLETTRLYEDPILNEYVTRVGNKLAANSSLPQIPWNFYVVDEDGINAFATQGGYVYINRGLMTFLTSEAQLAAVLAHEIAHIIELHVSRQKSSATLGRLLSMASSLAMMNSNVGEAISIWNAARLSGYGRDMELEADAVGAEILYKSGYEPQAVIEVLGLLKDHETFMSRQSGGAGSTYHGVFATHPRSDERLQEVVAQAGQLPPGEAIRGRDEYRAAMEGQVFGVNAHSNARPGFERFGHRGLGITFVYPDDWDLSINGSTVTISHSEYENDLILQVERMADPTIQPGVLLQERYQLESAEGFEPVYEDDGRRDPARTGLLAQVWGNQRVALIKVGSNGYYFESSQPELGETVDEIFVSIISSFRRANQADYPPDNIRQLYYRRLEPGETFIDLAQETRAVLGNSAEDMLRLINGYYPSGQPQPGTWIKLVEFRPPEEN
jgi:predicted Zn-dependent protease